MGPVTHQGQEVSCFGDDDVAVVPYHTFFKIEVSLVMMMVMKLSTSLEQSLRSISQYRINEAF